MFEFLQNLDEPTTSLGRDANVSTILSVIINTLLGVGFSLSIVGVTVSFIMFILSKGDIKAIDKARNALLWSVVAGAVSIGVIAIKNAVFIQTTGVTTPEIVNNVPGF